MKKRIKVNVIDVVNKINKIVDADINLDINNMLEDLKTSKFKVRALQGEIDQVIKTSPNFINTLWRINKIDQIVAQYYGQLAVSEKKLLLQYLKEIENKTVTKLQNQFPNHYRDDDKFLKIIKLEIFKDPLKIN